MATEYARLAALAGWRSEDSRHQRHPTAVARSLASLPVTQSPIVGQARPIQLGRPTGAQGRDAWPHAALAPLHARLGGRRKRPARPPTWYLRLLQVSRSRHFGDYGGLPLKILWALLDLLTIAVLISGLFVWLKRGVSLAPAARNNDRDSGDARQPGRQSTQLERPSRPVDPGERAVDEMGHAGVLFSDDEALTR